MIFDVQAILKTDGAQVSISGKLVPPADLQESDMQFTDVSFSGELANISGVLEFTATAQGAFTVPCARCAKETKQSFHVAVRETLVPDGTEGTDRDAVIVFTGTAIDLGDVIWPNILLELDTKYLCKPDCKGLCFRCGADLNEGVCNCKDDEIDPRLSGLANLLQ